ncbi:tRNA (adenosine(37)-N6)-dimethylallyltransferase MiaA [Dellaglioa sp. BT-FLS60]
MTQKVVLIVGPTAVGKTDLSIKLAKKMNGEIISGDSMQVYRHLDIGTAKVTKAEMADVPHHLLNHKNVDERYSVADFIKESRLAIGDIASRGKLPIIVGGTGFYLQALLDNFQLGTNNDDDLSLRKELQEHAEKVGSEAIWQELNILDSEAALKIPANNTLRVIRALEVIQKSNHLFSAQADQKTSEFDPFIIGLSTDRAVLYERINRRVDLMIESGLIDEAKWLFDQKIADLPAGKGIGYKELYPYFEEVQSLDEATELIKRNSRRYAKRQLTWFRNKMTVNWFDLIEHPEQIKIIEEQVTEWLLV